MLNAYLEPYKSLAGRNLLMPQTLLIKTAAFLRTLALAQPF